MTTLPNGLTVVSENASSTSTVSLTFPNAGSASETISESGAALANKYISFKTGAGLSSAIILRNMENDGATPFATASRHSATLGYTASKDKAIRLVPLLAIPSSYAKWDVRDAVKMASIESEAASACAHTTLSESLYAAAYGAQSAMGKSLYGGSPSAASIESFRERAYALNGAVLSATGIDDHESFVKVVEVGFSESNAGAATSAPSSPFIGGETRIHSSAGYTHVALAFEAGASTPLMNVVKQCITLSSEGVSGFASGGLVGVYGGSAPSDAAGVTEALVASITSAPSADIVERAKGLAKAEAVFALDGGSQSLAGAMAASVVESGTFSAAGVAAAYDGITAKDVAAAFEAMAKSSPALAAVGDLSSTPYQGSIAPKFG